MKLNEIVKDWGGFEKLIEDIHKGENIIVEHNVTLLGKSGATRQIDVLLTHKQGPYEYKTLIECKYWSKKVERAHIDVLHASMQDLNASKGVFFTTKGYQEGAEIYAKACGISIFIVKEVEEADWGKPGKIIDFYLQIIQKTIAGISANDISATFLNGVEQHVGINIHLGDKENITKNPIHSKHKENFTTIEELIEHYAERALLNYQNSPFLMNNGEECTQYIKQTININFEEPLSIAPNSNTILFIPKLSLEVVLKVVQSNIYIDRSQNFLYALSVIDYVNSQNFLVSKSKARDYPEWQNTDDSAIQSEEDTLQNGSILVASLKGYFDKKELDRLN